MPAKLLHLTALASALLLAACGQSTPAAPAAASAPATPAPPADGFDASDIHPYETAECVSALRTQYHVTDKEMWVMMHDPAGGICSNVGVTDTRIREIASIWDKAGCHMHTAAELTSAIDKHQCGGDAG